MHQPVALIGRHAIDTLEMEMALSHLGQQGSMVDQGHELIGQKGGHGFLLMGNPVVLKLVYSV